MMSKLLQKLASVHQLNALTTCKTFLKAPSQKCATSCGRDLQPLATLVTNRPSLVSIWPSRPFATLSKRPSLASRAAEFPDVVKQWHPHKNIVGPEDVTPFSKKKYWFICDEGHEWEAALGNRTHGTGCPTCNSKKVTSTNSLLAKYPAVAAEWHPMKNGVLAPEGIAPQSGTQVWWQCKEGHEWRAKVARRTGSKSGCPECSVERRKGVPIGTQSLSAAHPDLAQQWHPTKNGALTPDAVSRAADRKVWWQCVKDPTHEWEARI
eukprot:Colp12_sorted_trinity150504_noHs@11704